MTWDAAPGFAWFYDAGGNRTLIRLHSYGRAWVEVRSVPPKLEKDLQSVGLSRQPDSIWRGRVNAYGVGILSAYADELGAITWDPMALRDPPASRSRRLPPHRM